MQVFLNFRKSVLCFQKAAGVIVLGSRLLTSEDLAETRRHLSAPMVLINRSGRRPNVASIGVDFQAAMYRATTHRLHLHHVRIAYHNLMALGARCASRTRGLRVPEDLSAIDADDIAMAAHANPPLTTIGQPRRHLGRPAMKTLRRRPNGAPLLVGSLTLVESPLSVRASTGPAPARSQPATPVGGGQ